MERVVVAGSRGLTDYQLVSDFLDSLALTAGEDVIICGCARGADELGAAYALLHDIQVWHHPADWETHGRRAGYLRNLAMADVATRVVVFWDGQSRGSKMMINIAREKGITLNVVRY